MIIVVISILGSSLVYKQINSQLLFDSLSKVNKQTTTYVQTNIENIINGVNSYSKLIISSDNVQSALDEGKNDLIKKQDLFLELNNYMESVAFISDIYLSDLEGNLYIANKDKVINPDYLNSKVVQEAIFNNGSYSVYLNGKDYFEGSSEYPFVSFVRAIRDLNTQEVLGVLLINIPTSVLVSDLDNSTEDVIQDLYIVTGNDEVIHSKASDQKPLPQDIKLDQVKGYQTIKHNFDGQEFLVSSLWMESLNWHIVNVVSLSQTSGEVDDYMMATIIIIVINLVFIFVGVTLFSSFFVRPMKRMISKIRRNGENLEFIDLKTNIYEFSQLEQEYNGMITKIKALIENKVGEQKSLRKKELELLQAQIKPHFLYNTLDTIKLLSKKGENEMAFQAVKSLGKFYRGSLGKGEETIRISDEIDIVINYLKIQKFRYKDIFELKTYLEPGLEDYQIQRLILQPLVENALYHGIRPKGESGVITVKAFKEGDLIKFIVQDDGVGFDVNILEGKVKQNALSGYGVHNTIERLKIFYGSEVEVKIDSERGIGTIVTIIIPEQSIVK